MELPTTGSETSQSTQRPFPEGLDPNHTHMVSGMIDSEGWALAAYTYHAGIYGSDVTSRTVVSGLTIQPGDGAARSSEQGRNSIAVFCKDCPALVLIRNTVTSGNGGTGGSNSAYSVDRGASGYGGSDGGIGCKSTRAFGEERCVLH